MRIGYNYADYANIRNIVGTVQDADYVRVFDLNEGLVMLSAVCKKLTGHHLFDIFYKFSEFNDFGLNCVDVLHFFNTVNYGRTPWITTFETIVPLSKIAGVCYSSVKPDFSPMTREKKIMQALDALYADSCRRLIALSECSLNMQVKFLSYFPRYSSGIERKLLCLHPPQQLLVDSYESKSLDLDGQIRFAFVGAAFFRKGGKEILRALEKLRRRNGYNLKLTIVSSMTLDEYGVKDNPADVRTAMDTIDANNDWIDYHSQLANPAVLEIMKKSHVGLLPTYADTYGYSVLEFQACGCPVISTDVRALPEINSNEIGWLIKIPKNDLGQALCMTKEDAVNISETIEKGLENAVSDIFTNREYILKKANQAIGRIKSQHSREEYSKKLGEIYHDALH